MAISGDLVRRAFALLAGRELSEAEAREWAERLGCKRELVAYLLVRGKQ
jgi:hypothetical protein